MAERADIDFTEPSWADRRRVLITERYKLNYSNFVDRFVALYGPRTAFVLDRPIDYPGAAGDLLSYDDVGRLVNRMASALLALGVSKGDRVGLITANRIEMAFVNFACGKIGAIPVPMNVMLRPAEIEYVVQKAGIELLVCDEIVYDNTIRDPASVPSVKQIAMLGAEPIPAGVASVRDLMVEAPDIVPGVEPAFDHDVAMLFFTSGTTGFPKGAMLSHAAAMVGIRHHGVAWALSPRAGDKLALAVMPVAHAAGYAMLLLNLAFGTPSYFLSRFEPQAIFEAVERMRPTVFSGTPAMFRMLLAAGAQQVDWSSVRVFGGGADAFDDELVRTVRELAARPGPLGVKRLPWFIRGYGMAEANSYVAQTPPFEAGDNCCGWVLPPVQFRLVDERGNDVARGRPGELWLKGPNILKGYWNDPEASDAALDADGWFHTGDVLRQGKWRMLYFVGRSGDIIKTGGYKVSANEVDQHLMQHPDVELSATVGIPHPLKGERPFAAVKLRAGATASADDVLSWARERIAAYKCPRRIVVVEEIPMTFSMKPKRRDVRERLMAELPEDVKSG